MTDRPSRYSAVTRRAFVSGVPLSAIVGLSACGSEPEPTVSAAPATSAAPEPSPTETTDSGGAGTVDGAALPEGVSMTVSWTFTASGGNGPAKNPYMAAWIEDAEGVLIRTLALYHHGGSDDRWLNELSHWYQASVGQVIDTSGTVPPGTFTAQWDGKTVSGQMAVQGDYVVCVESAVEHGSNSFVSKSVTVGAEPTTKNLGSNGNLSDVSVDYAL